MNGIKTRYMKKPFISKSAFIKGLQCHKALYLRKHHPELEDPVSEAQQAIFDAGTDIGQLATGLFPGGVDLGHYVPENMFENVRVTRDHIRKQDTIYEAGFSQDSLLCFMDILVPDGDRWRAFEVKGSTSVKEVYLWDAAFQYYVMRQSGVELADLSIIYLNNRYVRNGELDIHQLFSIESIIDQVRELQPEIERQVAEMRKMLVGREVPDIDIGPHCSNPYPCSFWGHCWKHIPEYSVFNITRLREDQKFELYRNGIVEIRDIPEGYALSSSQQVQVDGEKEGTEIVSKAEIRAFLENLQYPLRFLDFETFNPAVPMFDQSRPYQQIPFQYSMHMQDQPGGDLLHVDFLAQADGDPRLPFIATLLAEAGNHGHILVYNKAFEQTRLRELGNDFPQFEQAIDALQERIVDLMEVFSKKQLYTPQMKGSYSIKSVLPALAPEFSYADLEIGDGVTASMAFHALYHETDIFKIAATRENLRAYCRMDTLAMVEILKKMEEKSR